MSERIAGRELDAEIAEKVMGWTSVGDKRVRHYRDHLGKDRGSAFYEGPSGISPQGGDEFDMHLDVPCYSTDIAAAFRVVEAMRAKPTRFNNLWLVVYAYNRTYATFDAVKGISGEDWTEANGEHATPLAICLAALNALAPSSPNSALESPQTPTNDAG